MIFRLGYQAGIVHFDNKEDYMCFTKSKFFVAQSSQPNLPISIKNIHEFRGTSDCIPLIPCMTLCSENSNHLKQNLARFSNLKTLISVKSLDKSTLEVAARDGRVDLLIIDEMNIQKNLTKGIISLARQVKCTLLFSLTPVVEFSHFKRTKFLRSLHRQFLTAKPTSIRYINGISTENPYLIRGPREYIALLVGFMQIPEKHAKNIIGRNGEYLATAFMKRYYDLLIEADLEIVKVKPEGN